MNASENKDSPEVVGFLARFSEFKALLDDDPGMILKRCDSDSGCVEKLQELVANARILRSAESKRQELYAHPANPDFISAWRDYEDRYDVQMEHAAFLIWAGIPFSAARKRPSRVSQEELWERADTHGKAGSVFLREFSAFAVDQATDASRWDEGQLEEFELGIDAWEEVTIQGNLDIQGILRRRALTPFTLVPRNTSNSQNHSDSANMLKQLSDAQQSFIFGQFLSCVALTRATCESALEQLYGAERYHLASKIIEVKDRLPDAANAATLDRLREFANGVLHGKENDARILKATQMKKELEILRFLRAVRVLIENG